MTLSSPSLRRAHPYARDLEQDLDRLGIAAEPVHEFVPQFGQFLLRPDREQPLVERDALEVVGHVFLRDERRRVDGQLRLDFDVLALQSGHRVLEHLGVEVEPDPRDLAVLLGAEQVADAAQFHVAQGELEPGPELGEGEQGREALARVGRDFP